MDRAKRRLSQASLPLLVNIASSGAFSAITDTDTTTTTTTVTTAVTEKKRKRKSKTRRTVNQVNSDDCETEKAKKKEDNSYFEAVNEYKAQKSLPKKQQRSAQKIVDDINKKNDTNVKESAVRDRVNRGIKDTAPTKGRNGVVKGE